MNHTESFVEALYCVGHSPLNYQLLIVVSDVLETTGSSVTGIVGTVSLATGMPLIVVIIALIDWGVLVVVLTVSWVISTTSSLSPDPWCEITGVAVTGGKVE